MVGPKWVNQLMKVELLSVLKKNGSRASKNEKPPSGDSAYLLGESLVPCASSASSIWPTHLPTPVLKRLQNGVWHDEAGGKEPAQGAAIVHLALEGGASAGSATETSSVRFLCPYPCGLFHRKETVERKYIICQKEIRRHIQVWIDSEAWT